MELRSQWEVREERERRGGGWRGAAGRGAAGRLPVKLLDAPDAQSGFTQSHPTLEATEMPLGPIRRYSWLFLSQVVLSTEKK